MSDPTLSEVFRMAEEMHFLLSKLLEGVQVEDDSGQLTRGYLRLTTALLGCKTVIDQMEKMNANR